MKPDLRIRNLAPDQYVRAGMIARQFITEFPDRMGFGESVVYSAPGTDWPALLVYRTKTAIVVRGS